MDMALDNHNPKGSPLEPASKHVAALALPAPFDALFEDEEEEELEYLL
jgi:hypothetical protein